MDKVKRNRFLSSYHDFEPSETVNFEHPHGVSLTVPNESLTIREIMERYTRNSVMPELPEPEGGDAAEFDDIDIRQVAMMDITDREEMLKLARKSVLEKEQKLAFFYKDAKQDPRPGPGDENTEERNAVKQPGGSGTTPTKEKEKQS